MSKTKIIPVEAQGDETEQPSTSASLVQIIEEKPSFIDLIKFPAKEASLAAIKEKRAEYDKITIDGVEDSANYKLVVGNMGQMRDDRRAFENAAYANVIDPLKEALKIYAADIDEVVEEFKAGEQAERDKKNFIDDEKKRIKKEAEEAKQRAALLRVNELNSLGANFDGQTYSFSYDGGIINVVQLKEFDDDEFNDFLNEIKLAYTEEQERINNELAAQLLEADRQEKLAESNKQAAAELNLRRTKIRLKELKMLGYQHDAVEDVYFCDVVPYQVSLLAIDENTDEVWDAMIHQIEHYETPVAEPVVEQVVDNRVSESQWTEEYTGPVGNDEPELLGEATDANPAFDLPVSTEFYAEDVIEVDPVILTIEELKEWAADKIIDDVRDNTPHGERGDDRHTMCFNYKNNIYEITVDNIEWGRHDKQYYFIDMYGKPNVILRQVRLPEGKRPILKVATTLIHTLEQPYTDSDISPKMKIRVYPDQYADLALDGLVIANQGKLQELNWVITPRT